MERQVLKITIIDGFSHVEIEGTEADYLNCIYATTHAVLEALFKKQGVSHGE